MHSSLPKSSSPLDVLPPEISSQVIMEAWLNCLGVTVVSGPVDPRDDWGYDPVTKIMVIEDGAPPILRSLCMSDMIRLVLYGPDAVPSVRVHRHLRMVHLSRPAVTGS